MRKLLSVAAMALAVCSGSAEAMLIPSTPVLPGSSVVPLDATGAAAGTLLATLVEPFSYSTVAGTTSGQLVTEVFQEAGGTVDFYYQLDNNANSATALERESNVTFLGYATAVAFRTDGSSLAGGAFADGTTGPSSADRSASGATVGFNFPIATGIAPGTDSNVLIISTNATSFAAGNAEVIDGGSQTLAAFEPAGPVGVPEPVTVGLLGLGFAGVGLARRKRKS